MYYCANKHIYIYFYTDLLNLPYGLIDSGLGSGSDTVFKRLQLVIKRRHVLFLRQLDPVAI